jgi:hypothetical protein
MKMPTVGLSLISGLDVLVKPLRRLFQRSDSMRFAAPNANHRNNQEYESSKPEQPVSEAAAVANRRNRAQNR